MGNIEQLVGLSRSTLQHLEHNAELGSALFQANTVLTLHDCSSLNELLRPLSLSGDRGLRRGVAAPADEVPAGHLITRGASRLSPPHPGASNPTDRSVTAPPLHRQTPPALPPAGWDSPLSRQRVHNLLNRVRQELKAEHESTDTRSPTVAFDASPSFEENKGLQSPQKIPGGSRRNQLFPTQEHTTSFPFPDNTPESEKNGWFDRHPRHKPAATGLLPMNAEPNISAGTLKKWAAAPLQTDKKRQEGHSVPQDKKRGSASPSPRSPSGLGTQQPKAATATASKQSSPFPVAGPGSGKTDLLTEPETASSTFSKRATPSSQLEQLVRKWQDGSQAAQGEQVRTGAKRESGSSTSHFSLPPISSGEGREGDAVVANNRSPLDHDHLFAETLERVLKREMRRHGIEEER